MSTSPLGRWENREQDKYSEKKRYEKLHSLLLQHLISFPPPFHHSEYLLSYIVEDSHLCLKLFHSSSPSHVSLFAL